VACWQTSVPRPAPPAGRSFGASLVERGRCKSVSLLAFALVTPFRGAENFDEQHLQASRGF
jgi:hypothetical protein